MATSDNRQLVSKLTFFPSYPLYCYVNGLLDGYEIYDTLGAEFDSDGDYTWQTGDAPEAVEELIYSLISMSPSKRHRLPASNNYLVDTDDDGALDAYGGYIRWKTRGLGGNNSSTPSPHDFTMFLGHNFNETNSTIEFDAGANVLALQNDCRTSCAYDGWSLFTYDEHNTNSGNYIKFLSDADCDIGTMLWGKKWEAPINVDINQTLNVTYGNKIRRTVGGKAISTLHYAGADMWGDLQAWELLPHSEKDSASGLQHEPPPAGLRTWQVAFNQIQTSDMLPQNAMLNNYGWNRDSTEAYDISNSSDNTTSSYNRNTSTDFLSSVYRLTMGSHLPCVIRISESNNPDQFAIVRISDFKITQQNAKFVSYSMTLEEQV